MTKFSRLEKIDLRQGWPLEDRDFTPWLGDPENLGLLGDALGLELEPLHQEHPVGPFRADLVCRDADSEMLVLIENQLEKTNHTHLGQLLTYAAGLQAATVVWIASRFTEEHQAALTWLNEQTGESLRFFGLEIELWQIGTSDPAPKFNIVAQPNDWLKAGAATRTGRTSERALERLDYWKAFQDFAAEHGSSLLQNATPRPQGWILFKPFGSGKIVGVGAMNGGGSTLQAEICFHGPTAKSLFDFYHSRRHEIEGRLNVEIDWKRLDHKSKSQVTIGIDDADWQDNEDRPRQFAWMLEHLEKLVAAFEPLAKEAMNAVKS
jgi:hypothetical protein